LARGGTGGLLALVASVALAALLCGRTALSAPRPTPGQASVVEPAPAPARSEPAPRGEEIEALRDSLALLSTRIDELSGGPTPPLWAMALEARLDARIERLMEMQERLAARIETPLPRLDEPIILFTVAASTAVLGFVLGRGLQRRRDHRDGRFRL
jgi:hypothetical protein